MSICLAEIPTTVKTVYEECSVEQPNKPHPTDCRLFYQCAPGADGNEFVEKSCGQDLFYNPLVQVCDWPANVIPLRPECSLKQTTPAKTEWTGSDKTKVKTTVSVVLEKNVITASTVWYIFDALPGILELLGVKRAFFFQKLAKTAKHGISVLLTARGLAITSIMPW